MAFLVAPIIFRLLLAVCVGLTRDGGFDASTGQPAGLRAFQERHKVIFWSLVSSYLLLFIAALFWMLYEFFAPTFNVPVIVLIVGGVFFTLDVTVGGLWLSGLARRVMNAWPKPPPPEASPSEVRHWQFEVQKADTSLYLGLWPALLIAAAILLAQYLSIAVLMAFC